MRNLFDRICSSFSRPSAASEDIQGTLVQMKATLEAHRCTEHPYGRIRAEIVDGQHLRLTGGCCDPMRKAATEALAKFGPMRRRPNP